MANHQSIEHRSNQWATLNWQIYRLIHGIPLTRFFGERRAIYPPFQYLGLPTRKKPLALFISQLHFSPFPFNQPNPSPLFPPRPLLPRIPIVNALGLIPAGRATINFPLNVLQEIPQWPSLLRLLCYPRMNLNSMQPNDGGHIPARAMRWLFPLSD